MTGGRVAGVDGCRGGWVVVVADAGAGPANPGVGASAGRDDPDDVVVAVEVAVLPTLGPLLDRLGRGEVAVAAIDMPIGLPESAPRRCDAEARALLGPRRSSVFPAPVRAALGARDHADACERSRTASGRAMSLQAFNLLPKVAELDRSVPPHLCGAVVEAHPELAFLRLAGGEPMAPKRTATGRARRVELVGPVLGTDPVPLARATGAPLGDLLDAAALVSTARHVAAGTAQLLGGGERDATGRPMRIAW